MPQGKLIEYRKTKRITYYLFAFIIEYNNNQFQRETILGAI